MQFQGGAVKAPTTLQGIARCRKAHPQHLSPSSLAGWVTHGHDHGEMPDAGVMGPPSNHWHAPQLDASRAKQLFRQGARGQEATEGTSATIVITMQGKVLMQHNAAGPGGSRGYLTKHHVAMQDASRPMPQAPEDSLQAAKWFQSIATGSRGGRWCADMSIFLLGTARCFRSNATGAVRRE